MTVGSWDLGWNAPVASLGTTHARRAVRRRGGVPGERVARRRRLRCRALRLLGGRRPRPAAAARRLGVRVRPGGTRTAPPRRDARRRDAAAAAARRVRARLRPRAPRARRARRGAAGRGPRLAGAGVRPARRPAAGRPARATPGPRRGTCVAPGPARRVAADRGLRRGAPAPVGVRRAPPAARTARAAARIDVPSTRICRAAACCASIDMDAGRHDARDDQAGRPQLPGSLGAGPGARARPRHGRLRVRRITARLAHATPTPSAPGTPSGADRRRRTGACGCRAPAAPPGARAEHARLRPVLDLDDAVPGHHHRPQPVGLHLPRDALLAALQRLGPHLAAPHVPRERAGEAGLDRPRVRPDVRVGERVEQPTPVQLQMRRGSARRALPRRRCSRRSPRRRRRARRTASRASRRRSARPSR